MTSREERIRARAQAIWESEGRPEGRADEHWTQAERDIASEDEAEGGVPKKQVRGRKAEPAEGATARAKRTSPKVTNGAGEAEETKPKRTARSRSDAAKTTSPASDEGTGEKSKRGRGAQDVDGTDPTGKRSARAASTLSVAPSDKPKRGRVAAKA